MHAGVWIPNPRSFHEECAVKKGAVDYSKNSHGARTGFAYPDISWKSSISRPSSIWPGRTSPQRSTPTETAKDLGVDGYSGFALQTLQLHPESHGSPHIRSRDLTDPPIIHCRLPCGRGRSARHPSGSASVARSSYQRKTPGDVRAGSSCRSFPAGTVAMHRTAPSVDTPATPHLSSDCERGRQAISQVFEIKSGIPRSIWPAPSRT